jgi:hypothetical protein
MANTTTTTGKAASWTEFYESKQTEVDLAITIASRPFNFLILTSDSNQVNLLHHCYNTTKSGNAAGVGIGIYGIRRSSPFKAFDPTQAMSVLQPPARPKKKDN